MCLNVWGVALVPGLRCLYLHDAFYFQQFGGKCQTCPDVILFQIWVVLQNLFMAHTGRQKIQYDLNRVPHVPDSGLAKRDFRVNGDPAQKIFAAHILVL